MQSKTIVLGIGERESRMPFFLLLFYTVVEYARPSFLGPIRPALILQIIMVVYLIQNREKLSLVLKEKFFRLYLAMMFLMGLHIFMATNNYYAYMQFQGMVTYLLFGISFCIFLDSVEKLYAFISFFVFITVLGAIDRLMKAGLIGASGPLGDENDFALAMNIAVPIAFFAAKTEAGWKKWFFWSACILFVVASMTCSSRGGFIGLVVVGAVCWVYSEQKSKALVAVAFLAVLGWNFASPDFKKEIMDIGVGSADKDTGKDRVELWKLSWRAFLDNPVLGVGQANMPIVMEKYQYDETGESFWKRGLWGRAVHSVYFTLLPELGLVGVALFLMMLRELYQKIKKIRQICRRASSEEIQKIECFSIAVFVAIFGFLVTGIFLSVFYYPQFWNMSALLVALFLTASRIATNEVAPFSQ